MTAALEVLNVSKFYDPGQAPAVYDLSLSVDPGTILALVGPSGCGKTTSLRLIAGFESPDAGAILLNGQTVADRRQSVPPERRGVGMVFQDHSLFPHLTAGQNVAFGLPRDRRRSAKDEVKAYLDLVGLSGMQARYPHELSGGERQRVALARALAPRPVIVLLDEPFSHLDADLRARMRQEVRDILKRTGTTALFVTHDQEEALFMGEVVAVLRAGRLEQVGRPEEVFQAPASRFVAEFLGHTEFLHGVVAERGIVTEVGPLAQTADLPLGAEVEVAIRADDLTFVPDRDGAAIVVGRFFRGATSLYRLRLPSGREVHSMQPHTLDLPPGTRVLARLEPNHLLAGFLSDGRALPGMRLLHAPASLRSSPRLAWQSADR